MACSRRAALGVVSGAILSLLAGCTEGTQSPQTAAGTATATGTPTATGTETTTPNEPSIRIQWDGGPVRLGSDGTATIRLEFAASGSAPSETDWNALQQPSGASTAFVEFDEYAEMVVNTPGTYTVELTATYEDGSLARDSVDITVE